MDETIHDSSGYGWSITSRGDRVSVVLLQPTDGEPRRIYVDLTVGDARAVIEGLTGAVDEIEAARG